MTLNLKECDPYLPDGFKIERKSSQEGTLYKAMYKGGGDFTEQPQECNWVHSLIEAYSDVVWMIEKFSTKGGTKRESRIIEAISIAGMDLDKINWDFINERE